MENTNQKNTGNIQIAPVSAAADLNHKREGYLTWDEYFMGVAMLSGMRSKRKDVCVIVKSGCFSSKAICTYCCTNSLNFVCSDRNTNTCSAYKDS